MKVDMGMCRHRYVHFFFKNFHVLEGSLEVHIFILEFKYASNMGVGYGYFKKNDKSERL